MTTCKMSRLILLLFCVTLINAESRVQNYKCNGFHANFNLKKVIGPWYIVAIIPEFEFFPLKWEQENCYRVEFSETEVAGFQKLVNKTLDSHNKDLNEPITGTILRQRHHSIPPFDVWFKSVDGVNGCFDKVLSLGTNKEYMKQTITLQTQMQLHFIEEDDSFPFLTYSDPFLIQMLWGRLTSVVIYRRIPSAKAEELRTVSNLMNKLRGPLFDPKICNTS